MNKVSAIIISIFFSAAAFAEEKVVYIYNWADYIPKDVLNNFQKETGVKIVYDTFDSNETLEAKLLAGNSGYDVVIPTDSPFMARQIQAGVYQPLNKALLPNYKNLDKRLMEKLSQVDPDNTYAVPYLWGTLVIGFNEDKVNKALGANAPVDSWQLIFDPKNMEKLQGCGVAMLDTPTFMMSAALTYLEKNPNSADINDYKAATDAWKKVRPFISYFSNSSLISDLANGDICVAVAWSGDMVQARDRAIEAKNNHSIKFNIPKEGTAMGFDSFAIPKDAKHVEEAHIFINYMLRADVAARASNELGYATANEAAYPLLDKSIANDPNIYPPPAVFDNLYTLEILPPELERQRTRLWTSITSGK